MSFTTLVPYILISISVILIPGPDMIFMLTQSITSGNKAGVMTILGSITGTFIHTLLAAAGLTMILQQSVLAFNIIKIIGAVYLLYLAIQSFREPNPSIKLTNDLANGSGFFNKGFIMNLSNPKVPIFFLTFFPQFVKPNLGHESLQIVAFGIIFIIETFFIFTFISIFASKFRNKIARNSIFQKRIKIVKGTVFGGLGIKLLL